MSRLAYVLPTAIEGVASPGGVYYTERQLYYEVCRRLRPIPGLDEEQARWSLAVGLFPALAAWLGLRWRRRAAVLAVADMGLVAALHGLRRLPFTLRAPVSYEQFKAALQFHSPPPGLLSPAAENPLSPVGKEPDLFDYGLPRLLVCQSGPVARMLRANDFHLELSCAVLTLGEASPLSGAILAMLGRTPEARVFFLHDASPEGLALVPTLRHRLELPPDIRLTAMGLRPGHARRIHLFARRGVSPPSDTHWPYYLRPEERAWLRAGWRAEVEALHPVRLLRSLRRIMLEAIPPGFSLRREQEAGFMTWPAA